MSRSAQRFRLVPGKRRARLNDLRSSIERILQNRLHSHFTDHSIVHCDRVAELAENLLIPLKRSAKLSDDEGFALYGGCYLHDIGMHNENAGEAGRLADRLKNHNRCWADVPAMERLDLIRRYHHEISADMVLGSVRCGKPPINFLLNDQDCPEEVASLCEAHCVDTASPRYGELTRRGERSTMRLPLLAAILRIADILDEAHHRAVVEQARTLDLTLESRMHWWRHHYTRQIEIEPEKNRITVWFAFPAGRREDYTRLIPQLQMPWLEQEFARHRAVLAENGLSWHLGWQVKDGPFDTLEQMPAEVESMMLLHLARRKNLAAQQSRIDLLKHFDESRAQLMGQLQVLRKDAEGTDASEFLRQVLALTTDLWQLGSRLTARTSLQGAIFFSTANGRSTVPKLHVMAATELAQMESEDHNARDAVGALIAAQHVAQELDDATPEKVAYYRLLSVAALSAGYLQQGLEASREAMRLLGPGAASDIVAASVAEALFLGGGSANPYIEDRAKIDNGQI